MDDPASGPGSGPVPDPITLPHWVQTLCAYTSLAATLIIFLSILMHLLNYRKPFQQRLMIRIQLIVPLFALSCYSMLIEPTAVFNKFVIEPVREIYEAFVIYTFFSLLTDMLGGEKSIVILTSGRPPVSQIGFVQYFLPKLDISDPHTFLVIKRGILQYVWLKPVICFGVLFTELLGWYDVNDLGLKSLYLWFTIVYNFSVSLSLYCLAIFWKILWTDLKPFNPVGKFLCVKLIIFASYWQGVLLAILNFLGLLPGNSSQDENGAPNIGVSIQNALLCVELIAFAFGHWFSFSYKPFTISRIPNGRFLFLYAVKDMLGVKDLVIDFKLTFYGDYYKDYKQFDSVDAIIAHPQSRGRMSRINQGLRYHTDGKHKHWLPQQGLPQQGSPTTSRATIQSTSEINAIPGYAQKTRSRSSYAASISLMGTTGTSTRGIYPGSPKLASSPPGSPSTPAVPAAQLAPAAGASDMQSSSTVKSDELKNMDELMSEVVPEINNEDEHFAEDEMFYRAALTVVNNYNLDQTEVKKLINYPIVDEVIGGHEYGYKVQRLRASRDRLREDRGGEYGSRRE